MWALLQVCTERTAVLSETKAVCTKDQLYMNITAGCMQRDMPHVSPSAETCVVYTPFWIPFLLVPIRLALLSSLEFMLQLQQLLIQFVHTLRQLLHLPSMPL